MQLGDAVVHLVQFGGHGVQLGLDHGAGFIHKVDGLIGQETVGDIPVRQRGGGNQRGVLNFDAVVDLVPLLQTTQNGDGILHGRLIDHNGLETTLQRGVFFDILAVLVQRGGADAVQLAARQHRLEQVAGIHSAVGLARADNGVQLINKQDDLAFGLLDLVQDALQALLKLAAVFGTSDQCAHIEAEHRAVFEVFGYVTAHDTLCKSFGNGGLADTGFTDQNGIVFALTAQNADDVANFGITPDDRVQLVGTRHLHEILPVFFQGVVGGFGVVGRYALVAAHLRQLLHKALGRDAKRLEQLGGCLAGALQNAKEYVFDADIFVLHLLGLLLGSV